jgi:hypothetical protein
MALRISRGLFRLWIGLAVIWIGGVGAMTWQQMPVGFVLPSDRDPVCVQQSQSSNPQSTKPQFDPDEYLRFKEAEDAQYLWCKRRELFQSAAIFALVPPMLALALGGALTWAFKGFR